MSMPQGNWYGFCCIKMKLFHFWKIMEFIIAIAYVVLILVTLLVRRALKTRELQHGRQFNVRSCDRVDHI
jgi:hypothetical protein